MAIGTTLISFFRLIGGVMGITLIGYLSLTQNTLHIK